MGNWEFKDIGKLGESISVQEMTGEGKIYLRITKLYKTKEGAWRPTDKGVSIPTDEVRNLEKFCQEFIKAHSDTGLTKDTKEVSGDLVSDLCSDVTALD